MSEIEGLIDRVMWAENELGRSLPYGPFTEQAIAALKELHQLDTGLGDSERAKWERQREAADELAAAAERLESDPENTELWTELYDRREQWRDVRR